MRQDVEKTQVLNPVSTVASEQQVYIDPIRFGGLNDIRTFDPALAADSGSITAVDMVFTGLVALNSQLQVQDQLAASHTISSDGLTYTFILKPGLTFSDGTPLTSEDVAYSINRALEPALKSRTAPTYLGLIKDADRMLRGEIKTLIGRSLLTPDAQTIKIIISRKAAYFLQALTHPCAYVVQKSMIDTYGNAEFSRHLTDGAGGAGPFVVASHTPGKDIQFTPNTYYYGPETRLHKVILPFYPLIDAEYKAYVENQLHTAQVTAEQVPEALMLSDKQYRTLPQLVITYVAFNHLVKPFDNIHIRQAFALALDKDAIVQNTGMGIMIPTNHIVPQGMPGYYPDLVGPAGARSTSGDVEKARELLQQGLREEGMSALAPVIFHVATNGNSTNRNQVIAMQEMWKNIGIDVIINDMNFLDLSVQLDASLNNPNGLAMWRLNWVADYPDPQNWLTLQFGKGSVNNHMNYGQNNSQQAVQQLMEQADANMDSYARMQQYNQAEQQLVKEVAWLPIAQALLPYVVKPCVTGQVYNAAWLTPPDAWGEIYISGNSLCANTGSH